MARLVVLLGPIASALVGVALGKLAEELIIKPIEVFVYGSKEENSSQESDMKTSPKKAPKTPPKKTQNKKTKKKKEGPKDPISTIQSLLKVVNKVYNIKPLVLVRIFAGIAFIFLGLPYYQNFFVYCHSMAQRMSYPSIMFEAQLRSGKRIIVDDYREAYWWLRDNTPYDSRVLSWWDYGYQISGIADRITLADGNTWNHEHIATLGRILTAPQDDAHRIARHLADYVLVWTGGGGDDLAKSPHMARIGNSVYPGLCPDDPTCSHFGFYSREPLMPTPSMKKSLLYILSLNGIQEGVKVNPKLFTLAYQSKYGKVRIYKIENVSQKSKKWLADPKNRNCDSPGSWYCPGNYPPALNKFIASRKDFKQLEDFNVEKDADAAKYNEQYMQKMAEKGKGAKPPTKKGAKQEGKAKLKLVGCYANENELGEDKVYVGGSSGASIRVAEMWARENSKKYIAVARVSSDGHSFGFNKLPTGKSLKLEKGCMVPCLDDAQKPCGCADGTCTGVGEQPTDGKPLRRWIVYELL
eukprot:CAMPEP_0184017662 /NCGR_PEP_ID=MMETSP0954-20121128/7674_1 /TAXON_ID=627963 /ORGANISM="Aplanochytrium sp, Strain PBS07" /LENGTH=524 /DNA_ID=CAMNT_0026298949 /DNA_START=1317 /DNA_END=2891 /DNA_ORIENTATION=+